MAGIEIPSEVIRQAEREAASKTGDLRIGKRLNLIRRDRVGRIIHSSVERALSRRLPKLGHAARRELAAEVRRTFQSMLRSESETVRGIRKSGFLKELKRSRNRILLARDAAREELLLLKKNAGEIRGILERESTASDAQIYALGAEMDAALGQDIRRLFEEFRSGKMDADALETGVIGLTLTSMDRERRNVMVERDEGNKRLIDVLERRVHKLTSSVEEMEETLRVISKTKTIDPGIASIYRVVQGLNPEDDLSNLKRELLTDIFEANRALQTQR